MVIPSIPDTDEFMNNPSSPDTDVFIRSPSPNSRVFHGFGYDQLKDDYKVIQCVSFDFVSLPSKTFLEIYSLKSNSWRLFDMDNVLPHHSGYPWPFSGLEVYMDGAYHWLVSKLILYQPEPEISLLSFDLSSEMFLTTPIGKASYTRQHLAVLNGSIALISSYVDDVVFHISILGELGVSESWIKLYTYGAFPSIQWPPIGFGKMGYIYLKKRDYELAYVDLSTKTVEKIGISGGEECYVNVGLYKESRLSIGGSSN
ncbi:F-box/kelch-repeat protein At3g06240-like [Vicia villosa]|uniref:F-box/kelch-repeat protein At3g06240-like n=1 Tax=Vicia villosa TaxID=3911 RepID=UPI00273A8904|nr:F-box/kelch-repeat protein At3g06240-like [Vicia villosa]